MSFASPPSRRAILSQFFAAGIVPVAAEKGHTERKVGSTRSQQSALFNRFMVRGPFPVKNANPLSFPLPEQSRDLLVRVNYPDPSVASSGARFPVVFFSHEELSSKDLYNPIADLWASHGIVTILPTHIDSESLGHTAEQIEQAQIIASRIDDLRFLLDHIDDLTKQTPALAGRIDTERIAIGGHGIGSAAALVLAGLRLKTSPGGTENNADSRIKALVSYNGVGPLPFTGDNWSGITIPAFAAAGTGESGATSGDFDHSWRWRMSPFSLTRGKSRYGVSIALGDHTYGGLICDQKQNDKPDATGLDIVNAMSTAFITAHLMGNKEAESFLKTSDLPALTDGRAFLERS